MSDKKTAPKILAMKANGDKIVCVTAYDAPSARIADLAGVDLILVGDSVGNVVLGYETTVPVTLQDMCHHTAAASRSHPRALLVADMPFGSYQCSVADAVNSAIRLVQAGAEAVKLEGPYLEEIAAIVKAGIPVMGHIGMTPQSIHAFGGFRVQGKGEQANRLVKEAKAIEAAGAFSIVLELMPAELSYRLTKEVSTPTIGIGAGVGCDGQIQVWHDLLGLGDLKLKHSKRYADVRGSMLRALRRYAMEVRNREFPTEEQSF